MFTFGVFGCWGNAPAIAPSVPILTLVDNEDGSGFLAEISGEDAGTTNTLYLATVDGSFVSQGSDWDSLDQMDVSADPGRVFAYIISATGEGQVVTEVGTIVVTRSTPAAADDNIPVAVRAMKQTAVYWPQDGVGEFGQPTYEDPVEISCRWEVIREEFVGPNGDLEMSKAKLIVDRDMGVKDILWLGALAGVGDPDDPRNNDGAWEVRAFKSTPNFRGNKFLREVYL